MSKLQLPRPAGKQPAATQPQPERPQVPLLETDPAKGLTAEQAAQRMAAENPRISACVYDLNHFPELREKYQVMSVPCLVINENQIYFGKKNVGQLLEILEKPVV